MRYFIIVFIFFFSGSLIAQEEKNTNSKLNRLSFEFGYGVNSFSMKTINDNFIDIENNSLNNNTLFANKISSGNHFYAAIKFQPSKRFDFGVYGSYQYGNSKTAPNLSVPDQFADQFTNHEGEANLRTEAIGLGLSTTYFFTDLLGFSEESAALNRLQLGLELNGGIGFSKSVIHLSFPTYQQASFYDFYNSQDFQGQFGLKIMYELSQLPFFTTFGLRFGYQYFRTNSLKDRSGNDWVVNDDKPINLDFSGFYIGTFLVIGK